jgi:Ca2+-binding RTX toxin-like protein
MVYQLTDAKLTAIDAHADNGTADDPYILFNGEEFGLDGPDILQQLGSGLGTGQVATVIRGFNPVLNKTFTSSLNIQAFDRDNFTVDGLAAIFEGGDDFINSALLIPTGTEPFNVPLRYIFNLQGGGSFYQLDLNVTRLSNVLLKPRHPNGKIASKEGGVMNGSNTAGTILGLGGKDVINANNGNDILLGGKNDDILNGNNGDDILFGGKGKDTLKGGAGADVLVVAPKTGFSVIKDFRDGADLIGLSGDLSFQDLSFVQQAKGTLMKAGSEKLAFLQGVSANQLSEIDFTQVNLSDLNASAKALLASTH